MSQVIRKWNDIWQEHLNAEKLNRIKMVLDGSNMLFFFKCRDDLFGASESSRVTFAKLKEKDEEVKDANFTATNLYKLIDGDKNETIFSDKDLSDIKVVSDKGEVEKLLKNHVSKQQ